MNILVVNCVTPDELNKPYEIRVYPDSLYATVTGKGDTYELALKDYIAKVKLIIDELNNSIEKINEKEKTS